MANYNSLKATIDAQIKANGVQAITGPILNAVLTAMINTIGNGYTLQGSVAQTTDNPGAPDNPVAYLAAGPGTYTNFGGTVIPNDGHAYLLTWDTSWHAVQLPLPTFDLANGKQDALTFDDAPTPGSDNPVKSNGIAEALDDKQDKDTGDTVGHVAVMDGNGNSEDGGVPLADLATKSEVAVLAGEAGIAEAVIDTDNAGTEQEFTFRKSGGDGGAYYRRILGRSLAWNQASSDTTEKNTSVSGGTGQYGAALLPYPVSLKANHKFFVRLKVRSANGVNAQWVIFGNGGAIVPISRTFSTGSTTFEPIAAIFDSSVDITDIMVINYAAIGANDTVYEKDLEIVDLTLMFGAGNEPSSVAEFEALYPDAYYPYNPGTLISNDAEAVETTGRNQYNPATGKAQVIGGQTYYIGGTYTSLSQGGVAITPAGDGTFTPASTGEVEVVGGNATDTIINISDADNGLWQPYWKRTLQLGITTKEDTDGNVPFADGMKGAGTAADWADKVGGEKRMGRVDLGDLSWTYDSYYDAYYAAVLGKANGETNLICSNYSTAANAGELTDKSCTGYYNANIIYVKDSALSGYTGEQVAAALTGVYLVFELATPVPFTWAEPLNLGVKVDENGTERAVAPEGATAPSAPFVADTTYTMSIARMVAILQGI